MSFLFYSVHGIALMILRFVFQTVDSHQHCYVCCSQLVKIRPKWKFIFNLWNLLDMTIVGLLVYEVLLVREHVNVVNPALDTLRRVKDQYHDTFALAEHVKREYLIAGILVVASWIKVDNTTLL